MKILIFNWQDIKNPLAGGAEVHLHEIFSRIVKMGHEVVLFCSSFKGALPVETIDGIEVHREGGRYMFNFRVPFRYLTRFRREGFDIVVDDMNKVPFFTPLFIRRPLYFIVHHLFERTIFREAFFPVALYVYLMEKLGVALGRWKKIPIMVVSESTKADMRMKGYRSEDIEFAYNCVDHDLYRNGEGQKSATPAIGYFGRLKRYKSIDHLLRAFSVVKNEVPGLKLTIVGDGDYRKRLESLAEKLGISDDVIFTGYVDAREKVRLLQKMWFVVNPSSKEGWGLTVIEANACGTTVIGSDVPGLRDAIKDNETGLLYTYGNIQELAKNIMLLLEDRALRERLQIKARTWSEKFDWNTVASHVAEVLELRVNRRG